MKTIKKMTLSLTYAVMIIAFMNCGSKSNDPTPAKSDLQLIKEGIIGSWKFVSAEMTKDATTLTYSGGCNFTGKPTWYQANAIDSDYTFTSTTAVIAHRNCPNQSYNLTYTVTESTGKFTINISDGGTFELITPASEIGGTTVKINLTPLLQGINSNVLTFTK